MNLLFDSAENQIPEKTCKTCKHRERWQCGGKVLQYCGVRNSNFTENGKLKIKVTTEACPRYAPENEKNI